MSNNKFLTRQFRGVTYDKLEVLRPAVYDRCYVFDMAEFGKLVVSDALRKYKQVYPYVTDLMDEAQIREAIEYFKTFPRSPMVVCTNEGLALALPWIYPASSYVMIVFASHGTEGCYRSLLFKHADIHASSSVKALKMRARRQGDEAEETYCRLFEELEHSFGALIDRPLIHGAITRDVEQYIYEISSLVGCSASVECNGEIRCAGDVDVALFESFVMIIMMCAKRNERSREVELQIRANSRNALISAKFTSADKQRCAELDMFEILCARKHLRFEYSHDRNVHHVYFEPMRIDWSILGVKQETE